MAVVTDNREKVFENVPLPYRVRPRTPLTESDAAVLPPSVAGEVVTPRPGETPDAARARAARASGRLAQICIAATVLYLAIAACRLLTMRTCPTQDTASYLYQAMRLDYYLRMDNTTNGLAYHGPGFPLLIRAALAFFHDPLTAAKVVTFGLVAGVLAVSWRLLHVWFQPTVARTAYLLSLSMLSLFETLTLVTSDSSAAFFVLAGWLLLEQARDNEEMGGRKRFSPVLLCFLAGLLFGGGYLCRYMVKLVPLCVAACWLLFDPATLRQKGRRSLALLLGFGIVFVGFALVCQSARGVAFPDRNHAAIVWQALDKTNSWINFQDYADKYPTLGDVFRRQGRAVLRYWAKTVYHAPSDFLLQTFTLSGLLLPLGFVVYLRHLNLARLQFGLFAGALTFVTGFFWFETRTLLPLMFWFWGLCSLAAYSDFVPPRIGDIYAEGGWLWRGVTSAPLRPVVLSLMFASLLVPFALARPWHYQASRLDEAAAQAGRALRPIAKRNETLAASVFSIGMVADAHTVALHDILPHDSTFSDPLLLGFCAARVDYVAYVEGQSRYEYPGLEFLLTPDDPRVPANFELVYRGNARPIIVIYRAHPLEWADPHAPHHARKTLPYDDGFDVNIDEDAKIYE